MTSKCFHQVFIICKTYPLRYNVVCVVTGFDEYIESNVNQGNWRHFFPQFALAGEILLLVWDIASSKIMRYTFDNHGLRTGPQMLITCKTFKDSNWEVEQKSCPIKNISFA